MAVSTDKMFQLIEGLVETRNILDVFSALELEEQLSYIRKWKTQFEGINEESVDTCLAILVSTRDSLNQELISSGENFTEQFHKSASMTAKIDSFEKDQAAYKKTIKEVKALVRRHEAIETAQLSRMFPDSDTIERKKVAECFSGITLGKVRHALDLVSIEIDTIEAIMETSTDIEEIAAIQRKMTELKARQALLNGQLIELMSREAFEQPRNLLTEKQLAGLADPLKQIGDIASKPDNIHKYTKQLGQLCKNHFFELDSKFNISVPLDLNESIQKFLKILEGLNYLPKDRMELIQPIMASIRARGNTTEAETGLQMAELFRRSWALCQKMEDEPSWIGKLFDNLAHNKRTGGGCNAGIAGRLCVFYSQTLYHYVQQVYDKASKQHSYRLTQSFC